MWTKMENLTYLGTAPVRRTADGRLVFDRSGLRFAPFGEVYVDRGEGSGLGFGGRRGWTRFGGTLMTASSAPARSIPAGTTETFTTTMTIRPQFGFSGDDLVLTSTAEVGGSAGPSLVLDALGVIAVRFGDREVWRNTAGVPYPVTQASSLVRQLIAGHRIGGGLDVALDLEHAVRNTDVGSAHSTTYSVTGTVIGTKEVARC